MNDKMYRPERDGLKRPKPSGPQGAPSTIKPGKGPGIFPDRSQGKPSAAMNKDRQRAMDMKAQARLQAMNKSLGK
jgi:hypothetical protein